MTVISWLLQLTLRSTLHSYPKLVFVWNGLKTNSKHICIWNVNLECYDSQGGLPRKDTIFQVIHMTWQCSRQAQTTRGMKGIVQCKCAKLRLQSDWSHRRQNWQTNLAPPRHSVKWCLLLRLQIPVLLPLCPNISPLITAQVETQTLHGILPWRLCF